MTTDKDDLDVDFLPVELRVADIQGQDYAIAVACETPTERLTVDGEGLHHATSDETPHKAVGTEALAVLAAFLIAADTDPLTVYLAPRRGPKYQNGTTAPSSQFVAVFRAGRWPQIGCVLRPAPRPTYLNF